MANLLWNESAPADTDSVGQGDDEIRSLKTSIRNGMAEEHLWPSASGANFGVHLLGSARPYYGAQSLVSSTGSDGRLMVTSDTSRLFHVGSTGTMFLGGRGVLSADSAPTGGQRFYWAIEFGQGTTDTSGTTVIVFPNSGFSGVPFTTAAIVANLNSLRVPLITTASNIAFALTTFSSGGTVVSTAFNWHSIGTRTF